MIPRRKVVSKRTSDPPPFVPPAVLHLAEIYGALSALAKTGWALSRVRYLEGEEERPEVLVRLRYDPPQLEKEII